MATHLKNVILGLNHIRTCHEKEVVRVLEKEEGKERNKLVQEFSKSVARPWKA